MKTKIVKEVFNILNKHGMKKLTVSEIASNMKISKKTIYEHFQSKDEIIKDVIDLYINENYEELDKQLENCTTIVEELKICCYLFLLSPYTFFKNNKEEIYSMFPEKYKLIEDLIEYKTNKIIKVYEKGVKEGLFNENIDPLTITFMAKSFLDREEIDENLFESFYEILLYGCIK